MIISQLVSKTSKSRLDVLQYVKNYWEIHIVLVFDKNRILIEYILYFSDVTSSDFQVSLKIQKKYFHKIIY